MFNKEQIKKEFRDFLRKNKQIDDELYESITTDVIQLNEMPRIFDGEVDSGYIDRELVKPIISAAQNKQLLDTGITIENCRLTYFPINKVDYIFALIKPGTGIVGATKVTRMYVGGKDIFYKVKITKKLKDELKNMLFLLYKEISKFLNVYVTTDNIQTIHSSAIWKKMFLDRIKYDIQDIKILKENKLDDIADISDKNTIEDIWGNKKEFENILVSIKFK